SCPKYLIGACHFIKDLYPDFNKNKRYLIVQRIIHGSQKMRDDPISQKLPLQVHYLITFSLFVSISESCDNLLFTTILSCCFYGCHWLDELI
ncbi:uncharacterized protein BT62DRAFT_880789, partial [Guyanagaster necrorhizus]